VSSSALVILNVSERIRMMEVLDNGGANYESLTIDVLDDKTEVRQSLQSIPVACMLKPN